MRKLIISFVLISALQLAMIRLGDIPTKTSNTPTTYPHLHILALALFTALFLGLAIAIIRKEENGKENYQNLLSKNYRH